MDRLIFSPWPNLWHRLRMRAWPSELDRRSAYLLKTGAILGVQPQHADDAGHPEGNR
ncbi:hypothetical protein [Paraburkholderia ultramafica]|nr:hypothetical protein [Paraburkholderia ultramafica]